MPFPLLGDGVKGFFAGVLLAGVIELGWHMFWHFTVPGASIAYEIAEFTGLIDTFAESANAGAEAVNFAGTTTGVDAVAGHTAENCFNPLFCPHHSAPTAAFGEAAGIGLESTFEAAPPVEPVSPPVDDPYPDLPALPGLDDSTGSIPFPSQTQFAANDLPGLRLAA